jgi:hypothetical protein
MNEELRQLRKKLDSKDPFMTRGHGIIKPRSDDKKSVPEWTLNDKKVREVVLRSFPDYTTNSRHRRGAARWIRIIHLYFRMGMTRGQVASEMNLSSEAVHDAIKGIRRVASGRRYDNRAKLGVRPRGRPKSTPPSKPLLAANEKLNLFSLGSFLSHRTHCKSKGHPRRRV